MDWVTENIAIGNFIGAENATKDEVDTILCLKPDCCSEDNEAIDVMCLALVDGTGNDRRYFNGPVDFIDDVVSSEEQILIHCHAGRSRSVYMTARYFMIKLGMTSKQALDKIETKREIYLSPGTKEILEV